MPLVALVPPVATAAVDGGFQLRLRWPLATAVAIVVSIVVSKVVVSIVVSKVVAKIVVQVAENSQPWMRAHRRSWTIS